MMLNGLKVAIHALEVVDHMPLVELMEPTSDVSAREALHGYCEPAGR